MPLWYNNDQRIPTPEDPTEPRPYDRISHIQQLYFDIFADDSFIPPVVDYTDMVKKTIIAYINKFLLSIISCGSAVVYWIEPLTLDQRVAGSFSRQCLALLSFSKTIYPHCCSPPRCVNGNPVGCERYFVAWCGMCVPLKCPPGQNAPQGVEKVHYECRALLHKTLKSNLSQKNQI